MTCRTTYLAPTLFLLIAAPLQGQDSTATQLDTVIVSAAKGPAGAGSAVQSVSVISGETLRAAGIEWISDALRLVPGAVVARGGSFGGVTSLFLRGGETRYTKVLIDGVAVNAVGGYFDFSDLSATNVERIEIVRGPGSVVHGADAMAGVVHVITRRGVGAPVLAADMRAGTYATHDAGASLSGGSDRTQYSIAGSRYSTDGTLPFNNDYRNRSLSGSLRVNPGARTHVTLSARHGRARYHYPTDFAGVVEDSNSFRDQRRVTTGLEVAHDLTERAVLRLIAGSNDVSDDTDDVDPPPPWIGGTDSVHSRYAADTRRRSAELRATLRLPREALFTAGVEYVREGERTVSSEGAVGSLLTATSDFAGRRTTRVAFGELAGRAAAVDYLLSARIDKPSDFGTFPTYRAGAGWRVGSVRFYGSIGTAFNAPSFSQLLPTEFTVGSPDLEPERALSTELGLEWRGAGERVHLKGARFDQRFTDLIQFVNGGPPDFRGSFDNLARARSDGWEVEVRALPLPALVASVSATWLDARVERLAAGYDGPLVAGQKLIRRARRSATAALAYTGFSRGTGSIAVRHVGARPDLDFREFPSPAVELAAYTVADVAGSIRLLGSETGDRLALTLRLENVFDRAYEEILHYAAPGRTILVGARILVPLRQP